VRSTSTKLKKEDVAIVHRSGRKGNGESLKSENPGKNYVRNVGLRLGG